MIQKKCGTWWAGFIRSQLIWIHTVFKIVYRIVYRVVYRLSALITLPNLQSFQSLNLIVNWDVSCDEKSVDPDQLAPSEARWCGLTPFFKIVYRLLWIDFLRWLHYISWFTVDTRGVQYVIKNPFITPSTIGLGFYAICQMKDQSVAVIMVHETLFYLTNLISNRLFKKHTHIHCIYFPPNCKDWF